MAKRTRKHVAGRTHVTRRRASTGTVVRSRSTVQSYLAKAEGGRIKRIDPQQWFDLLKECFSRTRLAEVRADKAEAALKLLCDKLVAMLSPDQIEAARIAGCAPEVYAIECVEVWKEKIFASTPDFVSGYSSLQGRQPRPWPGQQGN